MIEIRATIAAYDPSLPEPNDYLGGVSWREGDPIYVDFLHIAPHATASVLTRILCIFRQQNRGRLIHFHTKDYRHRMRRLIALMGATRSDDGHYTLQL